MVVVPSVYFASTQLQFWLFCLLGCGCCLALTMTFSDLRTNQIYLNLSDGPLVGPLVFKNFHNIAKSDTNQKLFYFNRKLGENQARKYSLPFIDRGLSAKCKTGNFTMTISKFFQLVLH